MSSVIGTLIVLLVLGASVAGPLVTLLSRRYPRTPPKQD